MITGLKMTIEEILKNAPDGAEYTDRYGAYFVFYNGSYYIYDFEIEDYVEPPYNIYGSDLKPL